MSDSKALTIIENARRGGALTFAAQGLGEVVPLYKAEATLIDVTPADFHNLKGKLVAKKETCDRFADAAGIDFIAANCHVDTTVRDDEHGRRTVFIGFAQGRVRQPDGSWRQSTVEEYEFDPGLRAKMDAGTKSEGALRLEYERFARQRAATGARMRVIRALTGMPTAIEAEKIGQGKALVFSRIVQNTDYILSTPEGRMMAIAAATGVAAQLYGGNQPARIEAQERVVQAEPCEPEADDWSTPAADPRLTAVTQALVEWAASDRPVASLAQGVIDAGESDPDNLEAALEIVKYLDTGNKRGSKTCADALAMRPLDRVVLRDVLAKIKGVAA